MRRYLWRWLLPSLQTSSFCTLASVGPHSTPSPTPQWAHTIFCFRTGENDSLSAVHLRFLSLTINWTNTISLPALSTAPCRCVDDDTVSFINASVSKFGRNGESSTVRYSFDMFRFTTEPYELFLHCTVQLCEPDDHESCKPVSSWHHQTWQSSH